MSDYFTKFSLVLSLPSAEAQAHVLETHQKARQGNQGDELPTD